MSYRVPTSDDPLIVTTSDRTLLVCWVEHSTGDGLVPFGSGRRSGSLRWVFLDTTNTRHTGPLFVAPESPENVQQVADRWWKRHTGTSAPMDFGGSLTLRGDTASPTVAQSTAS
jgi:hypothetical protein